MLDYLKIPSRRRQRKITPPLRNNLKNITNLFFFIFNAVILLMIFFKGCNILLDVNVNETTYAYNYYKLNLPGYAVWFSGAFVGVIVFLLADTRTFFKKNVFLGIVFFFLTAIWFFINEVNLFNLFIYYELFLLPSFLLVYYLSPNRRSLIASIYFLTWTQFGSLLVLISIMIIFFKYGVFNTTNLYLKHDIVFWLLFLGIGIKIPMWPFYYWLTKTHVEASSFFSIYLSGFLVKTAVYLFIKFYESIGSAFNINFFIILFIVGVIDSSIKMWHQTDLKKLIAYTTVQEMNLLSIPILWNEYLGDLVVSVFIITHCILSSLFFFIIDVILKRYNTRVTTQLTGLIHQMPIFTFFVFLSWIGFSGLPFTIKFTLELFIFNYLLNWNFFFLVFVLIGMNIIGLIGFSKNIFNVLFGAPTLKYIVYDLTKREIYLFIFLIFNLIILNYVFFIF